MNVTGFNQLSNGNVKLISKGSHETLLAFVVEVAGHLYCFTLQTTVYIVHVLVLEVVYKLIIHPHSYSIAQY